jgi:hypothetical protein
MSNLTPVRGCPFCGSSSIKKYQETMTEDKYACLNCNTHFPVVTEQGEGLKKAGKIGAGVLAAAFFVLQIFSAGGGGNNNNNNY